MPIRRASLGLMACCAAALLGPAAGVGQVSGTAVDIGGLELDGLLDPRVAAVSLHEELGSSAPASVFVLTGEDLRTHGYRTLAEALRSVPGLFTYSDGFYQYVGFRGVGLLVDYTVRTLVLVDGHALNNQLGQAENSFGPDLLVPLALVERIEVVKGPVGSVYGPAAFLGVVNVVTRNPAESQWAVAAGASLAQGSVPATTASAVGTLRAGGVSLAAGVEGTWTRGYTWTFPELASASDRPAPPGGRVSGADFADAEKAYLRASWSSLAFQAGCGRWYRGLPSAPYSTLIGDRRNHEETLNCFGQVGFEREVHRSLVLSGRLSHDWFEYGDRLAYEDPQPDGGGDVGPFQDRGRDSWLTLNLQARWQVAPALLVTAGVTGDRHRTRLEAFAERLPTLEVDPANGIGIGPIHKDFYTLNAYLVPELQLGPSVTLHAGLTAYRHEIFGSRLTPRAAVVWRRTPGETLKAIYTEGFRAPSASEAFFDDELDYVPNLDLRPETAHHAELLWDRRLGSVASVYVSAYLAEYKGLIRVETIPRPDLAGSPDPADPGDWRQQARNGGDFGTHGLEVGGRLRLGWRAEAFGGASLQYPRGDEPPNFASATGNLALSSRALWRPLNLGLRAFYVGTRKKDAAALLPGQRSSVGPQLRLDASAALEVPGARGLTIEASVLNVLDSTVLHPVANDFAPISQMSEPPRTVRLQVGYRH